MARSKHAALPVLASAHRVCAHERVGVQWVDCVTDHLLCALVRAAWWCWCGTTIPCSPHVTQLYYTCQVGGCLHNFALPGPVENAAHPRCVPSPSPTRRCSPSLQCPSLPWLSPSRHRPTARTCATMRPCGASRVSRPWASASASTRAAVYVDPHLRLARCSRTLLPPCGVASGITLHCFAAHPQQNTRCHCLAHAHIA